MPHGLEYVVRPYQAPNAHGVTIIPATPSGSRERATLSWGALSDMPEVKPRDSAVNVVCCMEQSTETARKSTSETIRQAGKPENYVVVRRPYQVKLQKKEKNKCASDWAQISDVAADVEATLAEFKADITEGRNTNKDKKCGQIWNLTNKDDGGGEEAV